MSIFIKVLLVLLIGLAIRVNPDYIVMSLIAWATFIYEAVSLEDKFGRDWSSFSIKDHDFHSTVMSVVCIGYFHLHMLMGWPGI